jgi:putative protease
MAAWAAALEAGADAVYAGFSNFSARAYADNFSLPELSGLIRESHAAGVKVYLAFNSLIKEGELASAARALLALADLGPDAFIVQDLGLAALAARHRPRVPLHASTLTAAYTRAGLTALKKLGFQRAVLPRELSLKEIEGLLASEIMPLEIFVHGSMCFSVSGLCLFSSFLGGRSALRGGCAQPCRRAYANGGRVGTFFSAADLAAPEGAPLFKSWPLAALKIEGRMKGPDYVSRTVRAYKLLLDSTEEEWPEALARAQELLSQVAGRPAGPGFLLGPSPALLPQGAAGLKVGLMTPKGPDRGEVVLERELRLRDRLRLVPAPGQEGLAFKLNKMTIDGQDATSAPAGAKATIFVGSKGDPAAEAADNPQKIPLKGLLYLTAMGQMEKEYLAKGPVKRALQIAQSYRPQKTPLPPELTGHEAGRDNFPFSQRLWLWLDDLGDLPALLKVGPERLVVELTPANVRAFSRWKKPLKDGPKAVFSLPPLLFSGAFEKTRQEIARLIGQGFREFMVANLGQAEFLGSLGQNLKIWGDHRLGPLNHLGEKAYRRLGLTGVTYSLELDQETYRSLVKKPQAGPVLLYLFGRPALFTSRFQPQSLKRGPIVSPRGEKYLVGSEGDGFVLRAESRIFMGGFLKGPVPKRLAGLLVDLRQEPRPGEMARMVKKAVAEGRGSLGSSFNFKRGLR